jgi:outer membrane protein
MVISPQFHRFLWFAGILAAHQGAAQEWSLDSCVRYALASNPALKSTALNVEIQQLNRKDAVGSLLPSLNAQANHGYNWGQRIDPFTNQFASQRVRSNNIGIATSVSIFSGFQQVNSVRRAELDVEDARWQLEKAGNDLALNVASAYLTVLLNHELLEVAKSNARNSAAQVTRMEAMVRTGQLSEGNLDQMNAQLAADRASEVAAQNNLDLAILGLTQLMQLDPAKRGGFRVRIPSPGSLEAGELTGSSDIAVSSALAAFPEIRGAQTRLASAEVGERIARGARYPRLTASYSYGTGYSGAARVLSGSPDSLSFPIGTVLGSNQVVMSVPQPVRNESDYTVKPFDSQLRDNLNQSLFFNLTIPIFNGYQAENNVKRAAIGRLVAANQLEQTRNQLRQEVERAYADARAARATWAASTASREASEKAFGWIETRFAQGLVNQADYATARGNLDIARSNEAQSKYDLVFRIKVLDFYQGKPISLPE